MRNTRNLRVPRNIAFSVTPNDEIAGPILGIARTGKIALAVLNFIALLSKRFELR